MFERLTGRCPSQIAGRAVKRLIETEKYREFAIRSRMYKWMDNGAFELGKSISTAELLDLADTIGVDEIVAPDRPRVPDDSFEMTQTFFEELVDLGVVGKYKIHVVPHGGDLYEYSEYFKKCLQLGPDVVGFSILDLWKWKPLWRPYVIHSLYNSDLMRASVQYHLLGLDDPLELYLYGGIPIRSVDCSLPISMAYCDLPLSGADHVRMPKDGRLSNSKYGLACENINVLLETARPYGLRGVM